VSFKDLNQGSEMIIYEFILTTFKASTIFWVRWGSSKNWLNGLSLKSNHQQANFSCLKLVKHTVEDMLTSEKSYCRKIMFSKESFLLKGDNAKKRKVQASFHFQRFDEFCCKKKKRTTNFFSCQPFLQRLKSRRKKSCFYEFFGNFFLPFN
jgi:hypothetical protein